MRYPVTGAGQLVGSGGAYQLSGASARRRGAICEGSRVYLLALDESGTHGTAPVLVVAGLAAHELDIRRLHASLDAVMVKHLSPVPLQN